MRKGPSIDVPVLWEYRRKDLPVRVIARHDLWRKVEDPDGAQGWLAARLLSRTRTAIVTRRVRSMRKPASPDAAIVLRAHPGVVGRISDCKPRPGLLGVQGRQGGEIGEQTWRARVCKNV